MSILDSLLRFVDIIEYRQKQQERQRKRKVQPPGADDEVDVELPPDRPPHAEAPLVCRVCAYQGGPEHRFCPRCLAETMERRR
jgi:hypothetical protein